ncbi:MAG: cobalamin-binding protein [Planctomycetaceae bacterium]
MSHHPRVVSLLSSSTEIVAALGCLDWLVGRSHECDYPVAVQSLPVCSHPRLDPSATSREIDEQVKALLADQLSIYEVDGAKLSALKPDVILTQTLCEVCAVSDKDVLQALGTEALAETQLVSLKPACLAETWQDIQTVADALGVSTRGAELVERLRTRMESLRQRVAGLPPPRVACIEWLAPLMSAGNWVPELVEAAGGLSVVGEAGKHSPWLSWEELVSTAPEVLVFMPCGFDLNRTCEEAKALLTEPRWSQLPAVPSGRVYAVDGNQYFNRPGPRLVDSAEMLAEIFHQPELVAGMGWRKIG